MFGGMVAMDEKVVGIDEKEVKGRVKKTDSTSVIIRINEFQGEPGVDIREFVETSKYTGLTKKGTRIPKSKWKEFKDIIMKIDF
jgi:hypothetical protein